MGYYRKRPVIIQALQYTGKNADEMYAFCPGKCFIESSMEGGPKSLFIRTLEGDMCANIGDFIIQGIQGEFYPCKPDIFAATYEAVTYDEQRDAAFGR